VAPVNPQLLLIVLAAALIAVMGYVIREARGGNLRPARAAAVLGAGCLVWVGTVMLLAREYDMESMRDVWTFALLAVIPAVLVAFVISRVR
jgi:hypothetical protein